MKSITELNNYCILHATRILFGRSYLKLPNGETVKTGNVLVGFARE